MYLYSGRAARKGYYSSCLGTRSRRYYSLGRWIQACKNIYIRFQGTYMLLRSCRVGRNSCQVPRRSFLIKREDLQWRLQLNIYKELNILYIYLHQNSSSLNTKIATYLSILLDMYRYIYWEMTDDSSLRSYRGWSHRHSQPEPHRERR